MSEIKQIELSIAQAQELVAKRDAVLRLYDNKDFQDLFVNGYAKDEAVRLTMLSADPALNAEARACVIDDIKGISSFVQFTRNIRMLGDTAEREIKEFEEALEDARMNHTLEGDAV